MCTYIAAFIFAMAFSLAHTQPCMDFRPLLQTHIHVPSLGLVAGLLSVHLADGIPSLLHLYAVLHSVVSHLRWDAGALDTGPVCFPLTSFDNLVAQSPMQAF